MTAPVSRPEPEAVVSADPSLVVVGEGLAATDLSLGHPEPEAGGEPNLPRVWPDELDGRASGDIWTDWPVAGPYVFRRAALTIRQLQSESTALRSRLADVVKVAEEAIMALHGAGNEMREEGLEAKGSWWMRRSNDLLASLTPGGDRGT